MASWRNMAQSHSPLTSLAELATHHAAASRVFHKLGLDFCCKGMRSLASACAERGIDAEAVLAEIATAPSSGAPAALAQASNEALVDHIVGYYHRRVREELPELLRMAAKVERVHGGKQDCPVGLAAHLERMTDELGSH